MVSLGCESPEISEVLPKNVTSKTGTKLATFPYFMLYFSREMFYGLEISEVLPKSIFPNPQIDLASFCIFMPSFSKKLKRRFPADC